MKTLKLYLPIILIGFICIHVSGRHVRTNQVKSDGHNVQDHVKNDHNIEKPDNAAELTGINCYSECPDQKHACSRDQITFRNRYVLKELKIE